MGVNFAHAPLDFEVGVRVLSLIASSAAFINAGLTKDERHPVGEGRTSSAGLKSRYSAIVRSGEISPQNTCENFHEFRSSHT